MQNGRDKTGPAYGLARYCSCLAITGFRSIWGISTVRPEQAKADKRSNKFAMAKFRSQATDESDTAVLVPDKNAAAHQATSATEKNQRCNGLSTTTSSLWPRSRDDSRNCANPGRTRTIRRPSIHACRLSAPGPLLSRPVNSGGSENEPVRRGITIKNNQFRDESFEKKEIDRQLQCLRDPTALERAARGARYSASNQ